MYVRTYVREYICPHKTHCYQATALVKKASCVKGSDCSTPVDLMNPHNIIMNTNNILIRIYVRTYVRGYLFFWSLVVIRTYVYACMCVYV